MKQLNKSLDEKRLHVPKSNLSQIKAGYQSDSDRDSMASSKKTRKVRKMNIRGDIQY